MALQPACLLQPWPNSPTGDTRQGRNHNNTMHRVFTTWRQRPWPLRGARASSTSMSEKRRRVCPSLPQVNFWLVTITLSILLSCAYRPPPPRLSAFLAALIARLPGPWTPSIAIFFSCCLGFLIAYPVTLPMTRLILASAGSNPSVTGCSAATSITAPPCRFPPASTSIAALSSPRAGPLFTCTVRCQSVTHSSPRTTHEGTPQGHKRSRQ